MTLPFLKSPVFYSNPDAIPCCMVAEEAESLILSLDTFFWLLPSNPLGFSAAVKFNEASGILFIAF